jgi:hypothetical protein
MIVLTLAEIYGDVGLAESKREFLAACDATCGTYPFEAVESSELSN